MSRVRREHAQCRRLYIVIFIKKSYQWLGSNRRLNLHFSITLAIGFFKAPGRTAWSPLSYHFPAVTNCNRSLWFGAASKIGYSIDGLPLPFVERIRDIGVYHDCRLKYDKHICLIVHNAYKRAVLMLNVFIHERDILKLAFLSFTLDRC